MDIEKLILGVFERKVLWDQTNKYYHNRDMSRKMWLSLEKEMNESSEVLKSKWRGLRDNFRKELAKTSNKGRSGDPGGLKWPYFSLMMFLKDSMAQRSAKGNISPLNTQEQLHDESTVTGFDYDKNYASELNSDQKMSNENSLSTTPTTRITEIDENNSIPTAGTSHKKNHNLDSGSSKGKKIKSSIYEKMIAIEEEKLKAYKEKSKEKPKEDDSDFHFCMRLLPYMRNIPEKKKLSVRIKIQQILLEAQQYSQSGQDVLNQFSIIIWSILTEAIFQHHQLKVPIRQKMPVLQAMT